jgi:hypothetical protein
LSNTVWPDRSRGCTIGDVSLRLGHKVFDYQAALMGSAVMAVLVASDAIGLVWRYALE